MEQNNVINKKWIFIISISLCLVIILIGVVTSDIFKSVVIEKGLTIKSLKNLEYNDGNVYANIETYNLPFDKELWCIATESEKAPAFDEEWKKIVDNKCDIKIENSDKYIYIRDEKETGEKINISDYASTIVKIEVDEEILITNGETKIIDYNLITAGNPDKTITFVIEDENIAKIEEGKVTGINDGKTKITISDSYGNQEVIDVQVTSLISLPEINNKKPFLKYKQYTDEEAKILDDYLFYKIDEAGYGTRAGVVAAARFLSLEFEYRIPYFVENGRLTHFNHQRPYCDGEGRYFHRGLFLSEDKYDDLEKSVAGPMMWGGYIKEWSEDNGIIRNGLDCSGFVCWCLINGGFDTTGDIGGGLSEGLPTLSDYGVSQKITMELLQSGKVKAGDPIGYDGHIGIIIGIDDKHVYVADTLYHSKGLVVTEYTYSELLYSGFTHIYDYTEVYEGKEGNYTNMW